MVLRRLQETPVTDNAHGMDVRKLYDTPDAVVMVITLQPGQSLRRHITPVDVAFYVLEGTGVAEIGEERAEAGAGTLVESPRGIAHCWCNESDSPVSFMVIKAPRPTTGTVFVGV
jgi:quercetin dioxygenase-like cupin family protein